MPKDKAEELAGASALANALQWATEINGGKPSGFSLQRPERGETSPRLKPSESAADADLAVRR